MSNIVVKNSEFLSVGDFEIERWRNKIGSVEAGFWTIISKKKILVFGNEFAAAVGFVNPRKAFADHVDPEDITTVEDVFGKNYRLTLNRYFLSCNESLHDDFFQKVKANQKLLSKPAIYTLCINSKLPEIKPFRRWVYDLIDQVLETGFYTLPNVQSLSLEETPVEKVESTFKFIPNFKYNGDNTERKELNRAFTTGKEASKNLEQAEKGSLGGIEKDRRDKSRIKLLVEIYNSKDLLQDENLRKKLEEIVINQELLEIEFG